MTFGPGERVLDYWLGQSARIASMVCDEPWQTVRARLCKMGRMAGGGTQAYARSYYRWTNVGTKAADDAMQKPAAELYDRFSASTVAAK